MTRNTWRLVLAATCVSSFGLPANGSEYNFTTIAIQGDGVTQYPDIAPPTIDQLGNVTFLRTNNDGLRTISRGVSPPTLTDLITPGSVSFTGRFDSNESGQIAFTGSVLPGDNTQLLLAQGGVITPVTGIGSPVSLAINDSGLVAFAYAPNGEVYTSADPSQPVYIIPPGGFSSVTLRVNNAGEIAFNVSSKISVRESNGDIGTVAESDAQFGFFIESIDQNEAGDIVFGASINDETQFIGGLFLSKQGVITPIIDTLGGIDTEAKTTVAINNLGQVAFRAFLDNDGGTGIYTGPDLVANKVIEWGDPLAGSKVVGLVMAHGLNDAGQIAFYAELADGRAGIFRADPLLVPEPSTIVLAGIGALSALLLLIRRRLTAAPRPSDRPAA